MIENYRKKLYKPVLYVTMALIVAACFLFILVLWAKPGDTISQGFMEISGTAGFLVVIITVGLVSLTYQSIPAELSRGLLLLAVLFLYPALLVYFVVFSGAETYFEPYTTVVFVLLSVWWLLSYAVLVGLLPNFTLPPPPAEPPGMIHIRARLYRPVLHICLWHIVIMHVFFIAGIFSEGWQEKPLQSFIWAGAATAVGIVVVYRNRHEATNTLRLYLYGLICLAASAAAYAVISPPWPEARRLPVILLSALLIFLWLFFLWVLQTPQKQPGPAAEDAGKNSAGPQEAADKAVS